MGQPRQTFLLVLLTGGACAAGFVLLSDGPSSVRGGPESRREPRTASAPAPGLDGDSIPAKATGAVAPPDEAATGGADGSADLEAVRRNLGHRAAYYRVQALSEAADLREAAAPLLPKIAEMAGAEGTWEAALALVAIMRIEGHRRHIETLARGKYRSLVARIDPEGAAAILAALDAENERFRTSPLPGLSDVLRRLFEGDPSAVAAILTRVQSEEGDELIAWIGIALCLRPLPAELGPILRTRLERREDAHEVMLALATSKADLTSLADHLLDPLLARLAATDEQQVSWAVAVLGRLGTGEGRVIGALVSLVKQGWRACRPALKALGQLGPTAEAAVPELIAFSRKNAVCREDLMETLAKIGSPKAVPFLAEMLRDGGEKYAALVPWTLVQCDAAVTDPLTETLLVEALGDSRPAVLCAAARCLSALENIPEAVVEAAYGTYLSASGDRLTEACMRALRAIEDHEEGERFVPLLTRLGQVPKRRSDQHGSTVRHWTVAGLAKFAPKSPASRELFVLALGAPDPGPKRPALHGLDRVTDPTDAEREAVEATRNDPDRTVKFLAYRVLEGWN